MKKARQIIYTAALLATVLFSTSCKKESEPGPAGSNGTNGTFVLPYKQVGTTLNLKGNFYSDDAAFDTLFPLSYFALLEQSSLVEVEATPLVRLGDNQKTSVVLNNKTFYITRLDSLGESGVEFRITQDFEGELTVNRFYFNVKANVTDAGYKKIYTTYYYNEEEGPARTSGPYDNEDYLDDYDLNNNGNSFEITGWDYNTTTQILTFDYNGVLTGDYNSTGNELTLSGSVKASVRKESLRTEQ